MEHHVCKGTCGHVSERAGMCGTDDCTHKGQPFEQCDCGDPSMHKKSENDGAAADSTESPE